MDKIISILIVDDEISIRNGLSNILSSKEFGINIINSASNGKEALDMIIENIPDIVLTDIRMPIMDGLELIQKVKDLGINTEFIILSGHDDFCYAQKAIKLGAKNYFLKPIQINELMLCIRELKKEIFLKGTIDKYSEYISIKNNEKERLFKSLIKNELKDGNFLREQLEIIETNLDNIPTRVLVFQLDDEDDFIDFGSINIIIETLTLGLKRYRYNMILHKENEIIIFVNIIDIYGNKIDFSDLSKILINRVNKLGIESIKLGIGSEVKNLLEVHKSYKMSKISLAYSFWKDDINIFDTSIICRVEPDNLNIEEIKNRILYSIDNNCIEDVRILCNDFFEQLIYTEMPDPKYIRGMCIYLITDIFREVRQVIDLNRDLCMPDIIFQINKLSKFYYLKEFIIDLLTELAKDKVDIVHSIYISDDIIQKVNLYVKNHIDEKILAKDVANYVGLSNVYFTNYFKIKTGINFKAYIIKVKMERAKQILEGNENLTLFEISEMLGYDDYRTFNRTFKQYTGLSPSVYQNKN